MRPAHTATMLWRQHYLREKLTLAYLWLGLCLLGAVLFMFRGKLGW